VHHSRSVQIAPSHFFNQQLFCILPGLQGIAQGSLLNVDSMAAVIIHKKIQAGGRLGGAAKGAPRRLSLAARVFGGKPPSDGEKKEKYPAYVTLWLASIHSYTSRLSTASRTHTHHTGALSSRTLSLVRTSQVPAEGAEREDAE
jgi:hypothetical protein